MLTRRNALGGLIAAGSAAALSFTGAPRRVQALGTGVNESDSSSCGARRVQVELVDAFVDGNRGGNIAGVVTQGAEALSAAQRQEVARQVAVSETAFLILSSATQYRLEFYTPTRSVPHCGHATVATFARLAELGQISAPEVINQTVDGPRRIRLREGKVFLEQVPAKFSRLEDALKRNILASLGIDAADLLDGGEPVLADNSVRTVLVGVRDRRILRSLRPEMEDIRRITTSLDAVSYYVFSLDSIKPGRDATARMFAPAYGIPEESATGMAAGPLACWLRQRVDGARSSFAIEQGQFMAQPSPSLILASFESSEGAPPSVWVGGAAKLRGTKSYQIC
jgi:PhzF family phenazine biosynthesis protein